MAEKKKDPLKNAFCSYIMALQSDRCCLVKSSLINLMRFYYFHPGKDFSDVLAEPDKIIVKETESDKNRTVKGYIHDQVDMDC